MSATRLQAQAFNNLSGRVTPQVVGTPTSPVTAGSLLVLAFPTNPSTTFVTSVTDTLGNTWVEATGAQINSAGLSENLQIFYCLSAAAGSPAISFVCNNTGGCNAGFFEFGLGGATASLDTAAVATNPTGTASLTVTTTAANDVGVVIFGAGGSGGEATGMSAGWTFQDVGNVFWYDGTASNPDLGTAGSKTVSTVGQGSAAWEIGGAFFKLAAGGGTSVSLTGFSSLAQLGSLAVQLRKREALIPGVGFVNEGMAPRQALIPGVGFVNEASTSAAVTLAALASPAQLGTLAPASSASASLAAFTSSAQLGALALSLGGSATLASLSGAAQLGALALARGGSVTLASLSASAQLGALTAAGGSAVGLAALTSAAQLGSLTLAKGGSVTLGALSGVAQLGALTTSTADRSFNLTGLTSAAQLGALAQQFSGSTTLASLASSAQLGTLTLSYWAPVPPVAGDWTAGAPVNAGWAAVPPVASNWSKT